MNLRRNIHSGLSMAIVAVCGLGASYMIYQASQFDDFYQYTALADTYTQESQR